MKLFVKVCFWFLVFLFMSCSNDENKIITTKLQSNRLEHSFTVEEESQVWVNLNDTKAKSDSNFVTGIQFQREGNRKGQVAYPDIMDNNLHVSNFSPNGYIEFQTEGTTKAAISPDGWIQTEAGLWFGPEVPAYFNARQAREMGMQDGQSFIRRSDGSLIVLRKGIN